MRMLLLLFITFPVSTFATSPSFNTSQINPVSVNDKGEILCKTRYIEDNIGRNGNETAEYGLCVISNGRIIEYKTKTLSYPTGFSEDSIDEYKELKRHYDWNYEIDLDFNNLSEQQKRICDEYGFKENNVEQYKVYKIMKITDFEKERNTNLIENKQLALREARSTLYNSKHILIIFDFGDILFLDNVFGECFKTISGENIDVGANFSYRNPLSKNEYGLNEEYELNDVIGVLFLNNTAQ